MAPAREVESGTQPALLIVLAGHGDDALAWKATREALRSQIPVVFAGPFAEPTPIDAAARLAAWLVSEQVGPIYLGGHDFGGVIALAFAAAYPDRLLGLILVDTSPEPYVLAQENEPDSSTAIVQAQAEAPRSPDLLDRLEFITTPTLVVAGEADAPFFQRGAELLHGWLPFSRLVRIANAAHRPHLENLEAFAAELAAFLREMEASRG